MSARAQAARGYRLRPAPALARRGSGASRIQWDRVGRVALVLVLLAICISYVEPALNFFDAWRDSKAEHASLERAAVREREAAAADRQPSTGRTPPSARPASSAWCSPGEGAYVVRGLHALAAAGPGADGRRLRHRSGSERTLDAGAYLLGALELALIVAPLAYAAWRLRAMPARRLDRRAPRGWSRRCSRSRR